MLRAEYRRISLPPPAVESMSEIQDLFVGDSIYVNFKDVNLFYTDWQVPQYGMGIERLFDKLSQKEIYVALEYPDGYLLAHMPKDEVVEDVPGLQNFSAIVRLNALYSRGDDYKAYVNLVHNLADIYKLSYDEMKPFVLDSIGIIEYGGQRGTKTMLLLYLVGFLVSTGAVIVYVWQNMNYRRGSLYRQLTKIGNAEQLEYKADKSVEMGSSLYASKSIYKRDVGLITKQIIVAMYSNKATVFPAESLLSVHVEAEAYRWGIFTIGKKLRLVLHFRNKNKPAYISSSIGQISPSLPKKIVQELGIPSGNNGKEGGTFH